MEGIVPNDLKVKLLLSEELNRPVGYNAVLIPFLKPFGDLNFLAIYVADMGQRTGAQLLQKFTEEMIRDSTYINVAPEWGILNIIYVSGDSFIPFQRQRADVTVIWLDEAVTADVFLPIFPEVKLQIEEIEKKKILLPMTDAPTEAVHMHNSLWMNEFMKTTDKIGELSLYVAIPLFISQVDSHGNLGSWTRYLFIKRSYQYEEETIYKNEPSLRSEDTQTINKRLAYHYVKSAAEKQLINRHYFDHTVSFLENKTPWINIIDFEKSACSYYDSRYFCYRHPRAVALNKVVASPEEENEFNIIRKKLEEEPSNLKECHAISWQNNSIYDFQKFKQVTIPETYRSGKDILCDIPLESEFMEFDLT